MKGSIFVDSAGDGGSGRSISTVDTGISLRCAGAISTLFTACYLDDLSGWGRSLSATPGSMLSSLGDIIPCAYHDINNTITY